MTSLRNNFSQADQMALVVVENELDEKTRIIYPRLTNTRLSTTSDYYANSIGKKAGRDLSIRNAVESKGETLYVTSN